MIFHYKLWNEPIKQGLFATLQNAMEGFIRVICKWSLVGEAYNIGNLNPENINQLNLIEKIEFILDKKVKFNIVGYLNNINK